MKKLVHLVAISAVALLGALVLAAPAAALVPGGCIGQGAWCNSDPPPPSS